MKVEFDFLTDTLIHISEVQEELEKFCHELKVRGIKHDRSKLQEPEFSIFVSTREQFKKANYGTPEYAAVAEIASSAVDHHYKNNRHHTKYHPDGVYSMNLIDIIELICDWKVASRRSPDKTFEDSLEECFKRYNIVGQLKKVVLNTLRDLEMAKV